MSDAPPSSPQARSPAPAQEPWFKDGLRFRCTQCGECCSGAPGYVWVNQEEIVALAARLGLDVDEFARRYTRRVGVRRSLVELPGGDCVFLDAQTRKCTVYEDRPRQCRTWPFWHSNVRTPQSWAATCQVCPGCGQGDIVPLQSILEQMSVIRI
jgi:Fe-S-cluster containining protein